MEENFHAGGVIQTMNERSLAYFSSTVRTGSFSLAAAELNVTQQSVSYSIGKLEDELDFPLFVRGGGRLELTYWGRRFQAWYDRLERELWDALAKGGERIYTGLLSDTQVLCFLSLLESGRLDSSAEQLHYAPATVMGYVRQLEQALGTELVCHRSGHYSATEAGRLYEPLFRAAVERLRTLKQEQRQRRARAASCAVVGISPWIDPDKLFAEVRQALDGDSLELHILPHEQLLRELLDGRLDLVFWSEGQAPSDGTLEHTRAAREQLGLIRPAGKEHCPVAFCPAWPRSVSEDRVIFVQELPLLHFQPDGMRIAESFAALSALLRTGRYAAVSDLRFGSLSALDGMELQSFPAESYVLASCLPGGVSGCAARLLAAMRSLLCEDTKD